MTDLFRLEDLHMIPFLNLAKLLMADKVVVSFMACVPISFITFNSFPSVFFEALENSIFWSSRACTTRGIFAWLRSTRNSGRTQTLKMNRVENCNNLQIGASGMLDRIYLATKNCNCWPEVLPAICLRNIEISRHELKPFLVTSGSRILTVCSFEIRVFRACVLCCKIAWRPKPNSCRVHFPSLIAHFSCARKRKIAKICAQNPR